MVEPTPSDRSRFWPVPPILLPDWERGRPHLPLPLTSFVGRDREVDVAIGILRRPGVRLVTLIGPGGVGKTRLAIRVAEEVAGDFPDGVWFVALAPVRDPALVAATLAQSLGVGETPTRTVEENLRDFLRESRALLVLDNLEHLLDAGPLIADLLSACPSLTVLATSRAVLRISGEFDVAVPPLSVSQTESAPGAVHPLESDATRLFVERACAARSDFVATDGDAPTIERICEKLDGLPLAIELAAARVTSFSLIPLLTLVERRLAVLTGGPRDQPARLRSMRDAIAWSHDLLSERERVVFRRLGIFVGGFTLEAAAAVAGGGDVLDVVTSLAANSLLRRDEWGDDASAGIPRFALLETVREFALEQLAASGDEEDVRDRHAEWCLRLAEQAEAAKWGPEQRALFDRVQVDHANVRAALTWLLDRNDVMGLRIVAAMAAYWAVRGPLGEARTRVDRALAIAAEGTAPPALRAQLLTTAGKLAGNQWDQPRAEGLLAEGVKWWREAGDEAQFAQALLFLQFARQAAPADAIGHMEDTLARLRALDHRLTAYAIMEIGNLAYALGDTARAIAMHDEAHALVLRTGDEWGTGVSFSHQANLALARGQEAQAAALALAGLDIFWEQGDPGATLECLVILATAAAALGRPEPAGRLVGAIDSLREGLGIDLTAGVERPLGGTAVRAKLGENGAAEAFAAGRTMSLTEAVGEGRALAAELTNIVPSAPPVPSAFSGLTPRELEVVRLIAAGNSNQEIADALFISHRTVSTHVTHIFAKLDVENRAAVAAYAVHRRLS